MKNSSIAPADLSVQEVGGPAVVAAVVLQSHPPQGQLVGVAYLLQLESVALYQLHGLLVPEDLAVRR